MRQLLITVEDDGVTVARVDGCVSIWDMLKQVEHLGIVSQGQSTSDVLRTVLAFLRPQKGESHS